MATTIAKAKTSVLCLPSTAFSKTALDESASTYTESSLEPGVPSPTSVATSHTLEASTVEGVSDVYSVQMRVADGQGGAPGGRTSARWIYRDTSETGTGDDWRGWGDLDNVRDVWSVNAADATGANQYQYPRGCVDKHGNIYVLSKFDARVRVNIRPASTGVFGAVSTVVLEADNNADTADRDDGDIVYVEEEDALYVFWPSLDSDASPTKVSVGVSVSRDQGATWRIVTHGIVPLTAAGALDYSPEVLRRVRAPYNPVSKTFAVSFEYDDNTDEWVYTTTVGATFQANAWYRAPLRYRQLHDIVIEPDTGIEWLLTATDAGTGSITDLELYRRDAGALSWGAAVDTYAYSGLDLQTGVSGWIHHNGRPAFMFGDSSTGEVVALTVTVDGDLETFDGSATAIINSGLSGAAGNLRRWSAFRWRDRVLVVGNGSAGNTDELLAVHLGGWSNLPVVRPVTSFVGPWAVPSAQTGDVVWTETTAGLGTVTSDWVAGYLAIQTQNPGGAVPQAYVAGSASGSEVASVITFKVEVGDSSTTVGSTGIESYLFFRAIGDNGVTKSGFALFMAENEYRLYDHFAGAFAGASISKTMLDTIVYFKVAYNAATHDITVWTSSDGEAWTEDYDTTMTTAAGVLAGTYYEFGSRGAVGSHAIVGYWSYITIAASTSGTATQTLADYAAQNSAYTASIGLSGMPLGSVPGWISKGLEIAVVGAAAGAGEVWTAESVAQQGLQNALIDGDDSPRVRWLQTGNTSASLVWDLSDQTPFLQRGFAYFEGKCITGVTITQANQGGGTTTLANKANAITLSGAWARSGNVLRSSATSTSIRWYGRDVLAGSYVYDGAGYFPILSNSPGYWTNDTGDAALRIIIDGDASSVAASGTGLQLIPRSFAVLWANGTAGGAACAGLTVAAVAFNATAPMESGRVLVGEYVTLPIDPATGRARSTRPNHRRTFTAGGYSRGEKLGPTSRALSFGLRSYSKGSVRYALQSSVQTVQVGFDTSDPFADAHQTIEVLESIAAEAGSTIPVVWLSDVQTKPGIGTSAVLVQLPDRVLYGYMSSESVDVTADSGTMRGDEIENLSSFTISEIV